MVAAVVPVKRLEEAKRRLSGILSAMERKKLCIAMLLDVLDNLEKSPTINVIYLVTPDEKIEAIVKSHYKKVQIIRDPEPSGLNKALHHATCYVEKYGISRILIVPGDLPLLKTDEIESLIDVADNISMTIVPDKTCYGTNLLLLNPPSIIRPSFGPGSFSEHIKQAQEKGISYTVFSTDNLIWDIDCPEDFPYLMYHGYGTRTYREVCRLGVDTRIQPDFYVS